MTGTDRDFIPALGKSGSLDRYDAAIALMTREKRWRSDLLKLVAPQPGERIVDIGCGTGTFAIALKGAAPESEILAVDPDPAILEIARAKADVAGANIQWFEAMGDELDAIDALQQCDKIVSSLVLHQCPMDVKEAIAAQMFSLLKPGGTLFIADYGEQRSLLMRMLFRQIQLLDGFEFTEPNAKGCVPEILAAAGFEAVEEVKVIPTPTGSISIYRAKR
ncbi:ubiquinone/menaquinone biosynthesis C-methylase UbiE [Sphingopyxis italica]|uniref:Methyltransferase type 11 n=2 Tax=Sphingopyxis TaxID=165697 RepID=A0AAC9AXR0_SPHMC|nr:MULTISPECIES: class I SAM-dependent methyltransferase [Sphingopyxis]ALJ15569.1 methyltransferase type 11 [Sphingopyxis macrogoltabida]AMU91810.1 methyltransferase type 11 [Sphingopyxis macrogoltabida]NJB90753.1 ubiquinone/menaquinone biosynthesis C-methylase UbiE [Sphingopyxis italica]